MLFVKTDMTVNYNATFIDVYINANRKKYFV